MSAIVAKYAAMQGDLSTYDDLVACAAEMKEAGETPLLPAQQNVRLNKKGDAEYVWAKRFAHAAYLHITLGYEAPKAWSLAKRFTGTKKDKLSDLYVGSKGDQTLAINTLVGVEDQNFKDTEAERVYAALAAAQARVDKFESKQKVLIKN